MHVHTKRLFSEGRFTGCAHGGIRCTQVSGFGTQQPEFHHACVEGNDISEKEACYIYVGHRESKVWPQDIQCSPHHTLQLLKLPLKKRRKARKSMRSRSVVPDLLSHNPLLNIKVILSQKVEASCSPKRNTDTLTLISCSKGSRKKSFNKDYNTYKAPHDLPENTMQSHSPGWQTWL